MQATSPFDSSTCSTLQASLFERAAMAIPNQPPPSYFDDKYPANPGVYQPPTAQPPPPTVVAYAPQQNNRRFQQNFWSFGDAPVSTVCYNCNAQVVTVLRRSTGTTQWIAAGVLCFVGCIPCCLIPFCIDQWQDITHSCPNCNYVLGKHKSGM